MKYGLTVYCRRNGISRDAGAHAQCEARSDAEAQHQLKGDMADLFHHYDEIGFTIFTEPDSLGYPGGGSRIVERGTVRS